MTTTPTPGNRIVLYLIELHDVGYGGLELVDPAVWGGCTHSIYTLQRPRISRSWMRRLIYRLFTMCKCPMRAPNSPNTHSTRALDANCRDRNSVLSLAINQHSFIASLPQNITFNCRPRRRTAR